MIFPEKPRSLFHHTKDQEDEEATSASSRKYCIHSMNFFRSSSSSKKETMKLPDDYDERAKKYGFATPEEVRKAVSDSKTYILDTRTPEEIAATGKLEHALWKQTNCTATECPNLSLAPEQVLPDESADILVYCRSGRRASTAKTILEQKGYKGKIMNAGGWDDVTAIMNEPSSGSKCCIS